jgi:hypothetical protein
MGPCCYYSNESRAIQITPWGFLNFKLEVLDWGRKTEKGWPAFTGASAHRRRGLGWGKRRRGRAAPSGACGAMRDGRRRRIDGGGRSVAEELVGGGTPVALGGDGRVSEHRWECGMLVGGLIWAEEGRS